MTTSLPLWAHSASPVTADVRRLDPDDDRRVMWVEMVGETGSGFRGVPLSSTTAAVAAMAARTAAGEGLPLVMVVASSGTDILEGIDALEGWGHLAKALADCSGRVPTVVIVDGPAVAGPALLLGLADLVVMTEASYAFVNGPVMVKEFTGVSISAAELGAAASLARYAGCPQPGRGRPGRRRGRGRRGAGLPPRQRG